MSLRDTEWLHSNQACFDKMMHNHKKGAFHIIKIFQKITMAICENWDSEIKIDMLLRLQGCNYKADLEGLGRNIEIYVWDMNKAKRFKSSWVMAIKYKV